MITASCVKWWNNFWEFLTRLTHIARCNTVYDNKNKVFFFDFCRFVLFLSQCKNLCPGIKRITWILEVMTYYFKRKFHVGMFGKISVLCPIRYTSMTVWDIDRNFSLYRNIQNDVLFYYDTLVRNPVKCVIYSTIPWDFVIPRGILHSDNGLICIIV